MEIIWGSTGKAIFRVYSKYEAGLLQYGWKGRNWVEYTLRKTNKTKPWCVCGGEKERSGKNTANIPGKDTGGSFTVAAQEWAWQGSWSGGAQSVPCCRQTNRWMGNKPGKVKTDSRHEGGGQRKTSLFGSHQMQCESRDTTSYNIKIDKETLVETERKCFAICTGWMNWSVLKWCLTTAVTIHSGLLQLGNKWHTGSGKAGPIKVKSSITPKADSTERKGNIFTCHKPALSSSLSSISSIIITIATNKILSPAGFSHKKTGQLVQTAFFPVTYLLNASDCLMW